MNMLIVEPDPCFTLTSYYQNFEEYDEKQKEIVELISREANIPKPTIYIAIKNLLNKKCLVETEEEFYEVDSRVKLYYKYCL